MRRRYLSSRLAVFLVSGLVLLSTACAAAAAPLRYAPKATQTIAYKVKITATLPSQIDTYRGTIVFQPAVENDLLRLKFDGGLMRFSQRRPESPFDRVGPATPSQLWLSDSSLLFGPDHTYRGIGHTTNLVSVTPRGEIRAMEGDSQLPYLIGNLSLLVFEPLPEAEQKSWTVDAEVEITEKDNSLGLRRPRLLLGSLRDKTSVGNKSTSFSWQSDKDGLSTFRKTYRLDSSGDDVKMTASGDGTWTFNRELGMSESLEYSGSVLIEHQGVTVTIPVTIKYRRLSEEERAKIAKEQKERNEKATALRKAPIQGDERKQLLADLKSGDEYRETSALVRIATKDPRNDEEIARAIRPLVPKTREGNFPSLAERALVRVSPDDLKKSELNKQYGGFGIIKATGEPVTADTPLPPGLIVAIRRHGHWIVGKIVGTLDDGRVLARCLPQSTQEVFARSEIRLAPPVVEQPDVEPAPVGGAPPSHASSATVETPDVKTLRGNRIWTDASGTFTVMARFAGVDGDAVRLVRKADGKEIKVPLARLCGQDRRVAEQLKTSPGPDNPFE